MKGYFKRQFPFGRVNVFVNTIHRVATKFSSYKFVRIERAFSRFDIIWYSVFWFINSRTGWNAIQNCVHWIYSGKGQAATSNIYTCYIVEQLERLRSEDTPRRLMITHIIESYWIPSQKKTKSKLQIQRICQNFNFTHDTPFEVAW